MVVSVAFLMTFAAVACIEPEQPATPTSCPDLGGASDVSASSAKERRVVFEVNLTANGSVESVAVVCAPQTSRLLVAAARRAAQTCSFPATGASRTVQFVIPLLEVHRGNGGFQGG